MPMVCQEWAAVPVLSGYFVCLFATAWRHHTSSCCMSIGSEGGVVVGGDVWGAFGAYWCRLAASN